MTYQSTVLADAPWGFWQQPETSGTSLADSSGNAITLTITGTPTLAQTGPKGSANAIAWPASTTSEHYATSVAHPPASTAYTLECWVYLTANPTDPTALVALAYGYGNNSARPLELYLTTAGNVALLWGSSSTTTRIVTSTGSLSLNAWHHIVASVDNTAGGKIRIDKVTDGAGVFALSFADTAAVAFLHGGNNNNVTLTNSSAVTMAYPAIYATALSDTRADAHFDAMFAAAGGASFALTDTLPAFTSTLTLSSYTDTSTANRADGRVRSGGFIDESEEPVEPMPANLMRAVKVDKAFAYPTPTLVDGRPT